MDKEVIEDLLRHWFKQMTEKYSWLSIRFEFNEKKDVHLVSFAPIDRIKDSDEFNNDVLLFSDKMNDKFGIDAPLFTDEEELFKLSDEAEVFRQNPNSVLMVRPSIGSIISSYSWVSSIKPSKYIQSPKSFHTLSSEVERQYFKVA